MMKKDVIRERRRDYRTIVENGVALCRSPGRSRNLQIKDLSRSGVCLSGSTHLPRNTRVLLDLKLENIGEARVEGVVVRTGKTTGIKFGKKNFDAKFLLDAFQHERPMTLVVSNMEEDCINLVPTFKQRGLGVIVARSPQEAIYHLLDTATVVTSIMTTATDDGVELMKCFKEEFPDTARILVGNLDEWELMCLAKKSNWIDETVLLPWDAESATDIIYKAESYYQSSPIHHVDSFLEETNPYIPMPLEGEVQVKGMR